MARPRKENPTDVMLAVSTGFVNVDGQEILIREGFTRAHRGSDLCKAYPGYFREIDVHFPAPAPPKPAAGEKRVA